jgi:hypothetical protein
MSRPMVRPIVRRFAVTVMVTGLALAVTIVGVAGAGLSGHKVRFEVRSPDSDNVCVSWYRTTSKQGPAVDPASTTIELEDSPWSATTTTGMKVRHWRVSAWAADDCESTDDPDGTVRCRIKVDGKVRVTRRSTDAIAFCSI